MERDPARRLHRAPAAEPHLLRGQVLHLSAARVRGAAATSASSRSALCMASATPRPSCFPIQEPEELRGLGPQPVRREALSRSSSRPTPRRCGACPATRSRADWAAQRIKGLSLWGAVIDGLKRSLGLNKRPNDGQAVKTLIETFRYPRLGPGMMWDAARDKIVAQRRRQVLMGHALDAAVAATTASGGWRVDGARGHGRRDRHRRARTSIRSAPMRELAARIASAARHRAATRSDAASIATSSPSRSMIKVGRPVPRQLDLHPRPQGEGRPGAELPLVVARDGARRRASPASASNTSASRATACGRSADDDLIALATTEMADPRPASTRAT